VPDPLWQRAHRAVAVGAITEARHRRQLTLLFDEGWNKLRETIFENQKKLGVIPQNAKLTPWPKDLLKEWDQLNDDEKKMPALGGGARAQTHGQSHHQPAQSRESRRLRCWTS